MSAVFADKCPANDPMADHGSGTVDGLYLADGTLVIFNEVFPIWRDGESATCVKNDVDDIVVRAAREQCGNEVGIEVGAH